MTEDTTRINWYPGHMAKVRRQLGEQLRRVDLVIELCDARLPHASRNPELAKLTGGKKRLLVMNKADLADPAVTGRWMDAFRREGMEATQMDATRIRGNETLGLIDRATREIVEKAAARGIRKTVKAMIVGVPNVGKSTLINRLHGGAIAKTGDRPGVTRASQWVRITPYLELLDTPGLLWPRLDDQTAARRLCYIGSISDEAVPLDEIALSLLNDLMETCPERVMDRFHVTEEGLRGAELMDAVCRGRGWLLRGGEYDYDRGYRVVLDEFRGGKLGRISLEAPEDLPESRRTKQEAQDA